MSMSDVILSADEDATLVQSIKTDLGRISDILREVDDWEVQIDKMHYIPRKFLRSLCLLLRTAAKNVFELAAKEGPQADYFAGSLRNASFVYSILRFMLPALLDLDWEPASIKTQRRRNASTSTSTR